MWHDWIVNPTLWIKPNWTEWIVTCPLLSDDFSHGYDEMSHMIFSIKNAKFYKTMLKSQKHENEQTFFLSFFFFQKYCGTIKSGTQYHKCYQIRAYKIWHLMHDYTHSHIHPPEWFSRWGPSVVKQWRGLQLSALLALFPSLSELWDTCSTIG